MVGHTAKQQLPQATVGKRTHHRQFNLVLLLVFAQLPLDIALQAGSHHLKSRPAQLGCGIIQQRGFSAF